MELVISIASYKGSPFERSTQYRFSEAGGTLGRGPSNTVILRDPDQFISRIHARIDWRRNAFRILVLGKNPVELNGREITQGDEASIAQGDQLIVGDYVLEAKIVTQADERASLDAGMTTDGETPMPLSATSIAEPILNHDENRSLFGVSLFGGNDAEPARLHTGPTSWSVTSDHVPIIHEPMTQTRAAQGSVNELNETSEPCAERSPTDCDCHEPHSANALRVILRATGISDLEDRVLNDPNTARGIGEVLAETIAGIHRVLRCRAIAKRDMRVDQTMMETSGNNPLKFMPDAKEALRYLVAPRANAGFMPPVKAIRASYDDIQAHNVSMMAGLQAALQTVFARFDPAQIESRLKTHSVVDKLLPMHRKARLWDLMSEHYAQTLKAAQDDFERLFDQAFAKAYQTEMVSLRNGAKHPEATPPASVV